MTNTSSAFEPCVQFFQALKPESLAHMHEIYSANCYFKDPFNEVRGLAHTQRIFEHMYATLDHPRFVITGRIEQGHECFLIWDFLFSMKRFAKAEFCIHGTTHLRLAPDGRIDYHRDYWDAAEELYEKLPLLGAVMRYLKSQNRVD